MKKIFSYFSALFFIALLAIFYPQFFLLESAKWTYENDMAQIDVSSTGALGSIYVNPMGGGKRNQQFLSGLK